MIEIVRYFNQIFHRLGEKIGQAKGKLSSPSQSLSPYGAYFTRPYLPVFLTLIFGLGLSLAAYGITYRWEKAKAKVILEQRGDNLAIALQNKIDNYIQVTEALAAFYDASDEVTRQEFNDFSQTFFQNYQGITGIAWAQLVLNSERNAYEDMLKTEGFPNSRIYHLDLSKQPITAPVRDEYLPVTYALPVENHKDIIGYDLLAYNFIEEKILEKARTSEEMLASYKIASLPESQTVVILFQAIYSQNTSDRPGTDSFLGIIYTVCTISEIVRESLAAIDLENIDFYLLDESADIEDNFLAYYDSSSGHIKEDLSEEKLLLDRDEWELCREENSCKRSLKVVNREWSIFLSPTEQFEDKTFYSEIVITVGFLLTGFITIYLVMSIRYTLKLEKAMQELKSTQAKLIQAEKMSGLGQLVAGVAHEVNNPVNFISGNIKPAIEYVQSLLQILELYREEFPNTSDKIQDFAAEIDLDFLKEDLPKSIESMKIGAERIQKIVLSLRNFSRLDEGNVKLVNLHEIINSALTIVHGRLTANAEKKAIKIITNYADLPLVESYTGQLNQALMNLLANAIDALEELRGERDFIPTIEISTKANSANNGIMIKIKDNGPGISEEILDDIFNPFFTTKPPGKGTGLGLSIAYSIIVDRHGGELKCSSQMGEGAEFIVKIPSRKK